MKPYSPLKRCLPREARLRLGLQYNAVREHGVSAYGPFFRLACLKKETELTQLVSIFHPSHSEAKKKVDKTSQKKNFDQSCMSPCPPDQNSPTTQRSSALANLQTEEYEISKLGIIVSKRVGSAVTRNKTKRRFREIYRNARSGLLPGFWLVIIAAPKAATSSFQELEKEWLRLGKKLSIFIS